MVIDKYSYTPQTGIQTQSELFVYCDGTVAMLIG